MLSTILTAFLVAAGAPFFVAWGYLALLSVAAFGGRTSRAPSRPLPRLTVLVPAHNEAQLIGRCVASLSAQTHPADRVVVIADNCEDDTATLARAAGAAVMIRDDPDKPGKGQALRWAMDALLGEPDAPEGIVVVDADSIADPRLLESLASALAQGIGIAQADYTVLLDDHAGEGDRLRALAVLLFNRTRNLGRARLGLSASLLGNGMLLSRRHLEAHPWQAFTAVEDLEYGIECSLAGVHPRFVPQGRVVGPIPVGYRSSVGQRMRWEGGRFHLAARLGPRLAVRLVQQPDAEKVAALLDLAVPPLWILALLTGAGLAAAAAGVFGLGVGLAALTVWTACALLAALHVLAGLAAAGAPRGSYRALLALPGFLVWKLGVYVRIMQGFDPNHWQRSARSGEV